MTTRKAHIRHCFAAVRPYLHGHLDLANFVRHLFGATEIERVEVRGRFTSNPKSMIRWSSSKRGIPPHPSAAPAQVHVYVEDVDAAYNRALEFGAEMIAAPEDKPYQERGAGVRDSFGNIW